MKEENESIDLEKLALGNTDIFHRFFLKYYPKVKKFILFFVKSEAAAEDLSQDIFFISGIIGNLCLLFNLWIELHVSHGQEQSHQLFKS